MVLCTPFSYFYFIVTINQILFIKYNLSSIYTYNSKYEFIINKYKEQRLMETSDFIVTVVYCCGIRISVF